MLPVHAIKRPMFSELHICLSTHCPFVFSSSFADRKLVSAAEYVNLCGQEHTNREDVTMYMGVCFTNF
jgi:hypothetical protein